MAANPKEIATDKKPGVFQWLIVIVVPLFFALIVLTVILTIIGVDVVGTTKETLNKVPIVNEWITTDEEELFEHQIESKETTIAELEDKLEAATSESASKDSTIEKLQAEIDTLVARLENRDSEIDSEAEIKVTNKKLIQSFTEMKAKEAAPILENMNNELVIEILEQLNEKTVAGIFAEMEPEVAATYINQMAE
ncbi:flagellar motility protein MotE (MotC chaperone) [Gracilibacillus halotolerans]|uniref:Flagellar motility protein MotE (MotC chaperone) n=1 Tax=Gracilibacillus halotolerans TaxID=74386 RepID=A0A841RFS4_9BACI|nr:hypothetical protein [Gracilibacillus halotolerans]MBB6511441.1 flagellar motility protein MotE (MotC chaperone) [Gracilibacillus halotolerans]